MKKKARRIFFVIILFLLLISTVAVILYTSAARPPLESIDTARKNLHEARNAEAEEYARDLLQEAEETWLQAMHEWKIQNDNWFLSRDFTRLNELSRMTAQKAREAYDRSITIKDSLHHDLADLLHYVEERLKSYEKNYASLPFNQQSRTDYNTAKMLFLEARQAYERGNYNNVGPKAEKSRELIVKSIYRAHSLLEDYFENLNKWKKWANETIEWSRVNSSTAIIIDKFARKCFIYQNGKIKRTFDAELGTNWIGAKTYKGDKATPEGKYHITKKKSNRETKYYKALLINYPNSDDKKRYDQEVKAGRVSKRAGIGNLIELHGNGGKGTDWTDGCVALHNNDMDIIYDMASVGTPVTIVGSLKSLKEVNGF